MMISPGAIFVPRVNLRAIVCYWIARSQRNMKEFRLTFIGKRAEDRESLEKLFDRSGLGQE